MTERRHKVKGSPSTVSEDDAEIVATPHSENLRVVRINPLSFYKRSWDIFLCLLLIYNAIVIPVMICFNIKETIYSGIFWINRCVDLCFLVDVIVCFETGIFVGEKIIMDMNAIWSTYLKRWFILDLIAAFPFDMVVLLSFGAQHFNTFDTPEMGYAVQVVNFIKITRLLRILRVIALFSAFEKALLFRYDEITLVKFALFVLFCLHYSACFFSWLDMNVCTQDPTYSIFEDTGLAHGSVGARYLAALYWAYATMATIGYGDVSARCSATRSFSLVVMVVSSVVYACSLSYAMEVIRKNRKHKAEFRELMDMANNYMNFRKLPYDLREEIRMFLNFVSESDARKNELLCERIILEELSPELRFAVLTHVNSGMLEKLPLFVQIREVLGEEHYLLQELVLHMQSQLFKPKEVIIHEGNESQNELFFITKGTCILLKWNVITLDVLEEEQHYGEGGFLAEVTSGRSALKYAVSKKFRGPIQQPSFLLTTATTASADIVPDRMSLQQKRSSRNLLDVIRRDITPPRSPAVVQLKQESSGSDVGTKLSKEKSFIKPAETVKVEYKQPCSFVTQTYSDLRYITKEIFDVVLNQTSKVKCDKIYKMLHRRLVAIKFNDSEREDQLRVQYPDEYEAFLDQDKLEGAQDDDDDDWRQNQVDIFNQDESEIAIRGAGGSVLRRMLSRGRSNVGDPTTIHTPRRGSKSPKADHPLRRNKSLPDDGGLDYQNARNRRPSYFEFDADAASQEPGERNRRRTSISSVLGSPVYQKINRTSYIRGPVLLPTHNLRRGTVNYTQHHQQEEHSNPAPVQNHEVENLHASTDEIDNIMNQLTALKKRISVVVDRRSSSPPRSVQLDRSTSGNDQGLPMSYSTKFKRFSFDSSDSIDTFSEEKAEVLTDINMNDLLKVGISESSADKKKANLVISTSIESQDSNVI